VAAQTTSGLSWSGAGAAVTLLTTGAVTAIMGVIYFMLTSVQA